MITRGLSCDRIGFGHFWGGGGGGQMTPLTPHGYGPVIYVMPPSLIIIVGTLQYNTI